MPYHTGHIGIYLPEGAIEDTEAEFSFTSQWDAGGEYGPSGWIIEDITLLHVKLGGLHLTRPQMATMIGEDAVATIEAGQVEPIAQAVEAGDYRWAAE